MKPFPTQSLVSHTVCALIVAAAIPFSAGYAQESGSDTKKKETDQSRDAIARYIAAHSQSGKFAIYDSRSNAPMALDLVDIHSGAHPVASGETYHCADFRNADGVLYDLDFYVDGSGEEPVIVETFIHKVGKQDRIRPTKNASAASEQVASKVRQAITNSWQNKQTIVDPRTGQAIEFTFEEVHNSVKPVAGGAYFACVDARDTAGTLYDLDTYVVPAGDGSFEVAETIIHKADGVERLRAK